ncbi:Metallo-beta-lactamase protein [Mycena kentingensis (nom. inval.)]|nr:Metallo-beta-lactamase protein [Mycena kentingensis (nom. inval.)]
MSRIDSQCMSVPATPKIGPVSLPDFDPQPDVNDPKPRKRRLSSLLAKVRGGGGSTRSTTPAPVPVTRYEYPPSGPSQRPRASSMTSSTDAKLKQPVNAVAPRFSEPSSRSKTHYRQVSAPQTTPWMPPANAYVPGKHQGPETPKYMKAVVKEVATKEESVVLSWPLVPYADRRHLKYPLVYYDLAFDPQDDMNVKDNRHTLFLALPKVDRELPVSTHCKITEMVIDCPLVGSLVVARPEGLRCLDVFFAIWQKECYQKRPHRNEMPQNLDKYKRAFEQRCIDAPGLAEYNRTVTGFLRVDLLRGRRIFEGLRRGTNGRWELSIDGVPRRHH